MSPNEFQISLSAIDKERFGIEIAKASFVTENSIPAILEFCTTHAVSLLIARCDVKNIRAVQAMETQGFLLMDTLVYYQCDLKTKPVLSATQNIVVRPVRPGEQGRVWQIAFDAFKGYVGHYHSDPRLARDQCDETYASWAYRSCAVGEAADEVLVAETNGSLEGFVALKMDSPEEVAITLNAVRPSEQGKGIYSALVLAAKEWCWKKEVTRITISTQLTNVVVQKVWSRQGFWLSHGFYTLHKWFDQIASIH
jgi:GNAT superfamily N-acetyltransferase